MPVTRGKRVEVPRAEFEAEDHDEYFEDQPPTEYQEPPAKAPRGRRPKKPETPPPVVLDDEEDLREMQQQEQAQYQQEPYQQEEYAPEQQMDNQGPPQLEPQHGPAEEPTEEPMNEADEMHMQAQAQRRLGFVDRRPMRPETSTGRGADEGMSVQQDLRTVEFNFLDNKNICCGLCGEIVPYEQLMSEHLPQNHPEILGDGDMTMEEIPYEEWLREKLRAEKRAIESGFKLTSYEAPARLHRTPGKPQRRVSQIRVNPIEMSIQQLDVALRKKMFEKMGRKVPVTLVDKAHARCGLCNAVVSLNKKFEVVHLVRHFNAWHPSTHRCAGSWMNRAPIRDGIKPLSMHDFAVIDSNTATPDNLQCIWCGMFMDTESLAMHFDEVHPDDIEVPKCNLCLQELVLNARMTEKYGEDYEITLPDEHHILCAKFSMTFGSEGALERGIERKLAKNERRAAAEAAGEPIDDDDEIEEEEEVGPEAFLNSRMSLGKRKKPKRQFIMPALRQAAPIDSDYVEPVTECHWKCKICKEDILAAVISAGAIKHYRTQHPEHVDNMQYELCKARLERVSDGCMEFVHPQLIECLLCNMTYNLHKPFNMCRAIRHLKSKHPNLMPEYSGVTPRQSTGAMHQRVTPRPPPIRKQPGMAGPSSAGSNQPQEMQLQMVDNVDTLKETYGIDLSKIEGADGDGDQVYVLLQDGEELDPEMANQLAVAMQSGDGLQMLQGGGDEGSSSGTRVFTLSMTKQGQMEGESKPKAGEDLGVPSSSTASEGTNPQLSDLQMPTTGLHRNQAPPMPEQLLEPTAE